MRLRTNAPLMCMKGSCGQQQTGGEQEEVAIVHIDALVDHGGHRRSIGTGITAQIFAQIFVIAGIFK